MANPVAARLAGDDYQHLYAWCHALGLLLPRLMLSEVWVEDERAGSFDDITLHYSKESGRGGAFIQVKYHVDQRDRYSTAVLLARPAGSSLLQKFFRTWQKLRATGGSAPELTLFSNWGWDSQDAMGKCIDGRTGSFTPEFLTAGSLSDVGKLRDQWISECQASAEDFAAFIYCLRLRLGSINAFEDVADRTAERMSNLGLRHDDAALTLCCGIVRNWIKAGRQQLTRENLQAVIAANQLRVASEERAVTVYLETIKKRHFDLEPDYLLDWRHYFGGSEYARDHRIIDPACWNGSMLPELQALEEQVNKECRPQLIRARGLSRLSPWFAFGYVFSRVAGYEIEVKQGAALWRTDSRASAEFHLVATRAPKEGERATTLAVGLSVTGRLGADVERYLASSGFKGALLLLEPAVGAAGDVFRGAGDVVAFKNEAKQAIRHWVDATGAEDLLLFYFGPLSGACFLGHDLNALGCRVLVMEDQSPGYAAAFLLS